jgi:hypothetical protein
MGATLTTTPLRQILFFISGSKEKTTGYIEKLLQNLRTKHKRANAIHLTEVCLKQGYIFGENNKGVQEKIRTLNYIEKIKNKQVNLETLPQQFSKYLNSYRQTKILEIVPDNETPEQEEHRDTEFEKHKDYLRDFEKTLRMLRRAGRMLIPNWEEIEKLEDESDPHTSAYIAHISKEKTENTELAVQAELAWEKYAIQARISILKNLHATPQDFKIEPYTVQILMLRSQGFLGFPYNGPKKLELATFDAQDEEDRYILETHIKGLKIEDTPLASCYRQKPWHTPQHFYPIQTPQILENPTQYSKPPATFLPESPLLHFLEPAKENPKIKISTALLPKPDPETELYLENDNLLISLYNPVAGKPTGFKDALLWKPILTKKGIHYVESRLEKFGYGLLASSEVHQYAEKKVKQAERALAPNYPLTSYESLAYFENEARVAQKTVLHPDTQEPLWIAGKSYHITPSWKRETMLVDHAIEDEQPEETCENTEDILTLGKAENATKIENSDRIKTLTERRINYGFSTFLVEAENKRIYEIKETVTKDTYGMEKERIAIDIDHLKTRTEELEKQGTPTHRDQKELQEKLSRIQALEKQLEEWQPILEDFLDAFPPQPPALALDVYQTEIEVAMKKIYSRFGPLLTNENGECTIKNYQLKLSALGAIKRGHANGSSPGSGKTMMATFSSWYMNHPYTYVICPTIAMKTWAKELERLGLYHEIVGMQKDENGNWIERSGVYNHMKELNKRFHKRIRTPNRLGKIETEYYIVSAESVALGGEGNRTYNPWHADYFFPNSLQIDKLTKETSIVNKLREAIDNKEVELPPTATYGTTSKKTKVGMFLRIWSDRSDNSKEIEKHGLKSLCKTVRFANTILCCPKCKSGRPEWTTHGHCNKCHYSHSAITKKQSGFNTEKYNRFEDATYEKATFQNTSTLPPQNRKFTGDKTSNRQFPLYKFMRKHVGCKIIDEIHNWANFESQHGAALFQVKTKDSIVLSGTLCKTHIHELEPTLCQIYEPNSGEFPYSPWGMELFKEQFQTIETEEVTKTTTSEAKTNVRRKKSSKLVPEASNLTKLRALLHGVTCTVSESEMEKVWELQPIKEKIQYVELRPSNAEIYTNWERMLREMYQECKTEQEKTGVLRNARSKLTQLAYACDGPEKLEAALTWVKDCIEKKERCVIVGPSTRFYMMLHKALKDAQIPFMGLSNIAPEKRFEYLDKFRNSDCPVFLSRIRLVNVNFNQLTCCTKILFTGIDPSPAAIRQMQKRLNRIGQTEEVECTFLITQLPEQIIRNQEVGASVDGVDQIDAYDTQTEAQPSQEDETTTRRYRPISYEERLFSLVLRRETAIKQTLQQVERQRDPQELYEMLKDRQTITQVLQDIAENVKETTKLETQIQTTPITPTPIPEKIQTIKHVEPKPLVKTPVKVFWKETPKNKTAFQGELFSF